MEHILVSSTITYIGTQFSGSRLVVWDYLKQVPVISSSISIENFINGTQWSPSGDLIALGVGNNVLLWDWKLKDTSNDFVRGKITGSQFCLVRRRDDRLLADPKKEISISGILESGEKIRTIKAHNERVEEMILVSWRWINLSVWVVMMKIPLRFGN